jgi:hypothetical protein
MVALRVIKIVGIIGLTIALAITASILPPRLQSQAMLPEAGEESQVIEEQISPSGNATATITITMTGVSDS